MGGVLPRLAGVGEGAALRRAKGPLQFMHRGLWHVQRTCLTGNVIHATCPSCIALEAIIHKCSQVRKRDAQASVGGWVVIGVHGPAANAAGGL